MSKIKNYLIVVAMVMIAFCLYGLPNFYAPDETRYSEVAREMLVNHDFIVPYINGIICFFKPPIIYWITCIFMSVFGDNAWAARLVNPFLLTLCLLAVYYAVQLVLESKIIAMLSVVITLTTVIIIFTGRYLNMDLGIAVFLNLTMLSYWISLKYDDDYAKSTFWLILAFIFSGLAVMTKGFMGVVFPIAIVGLYSIVMKEWRRLLDIRLYLGLIIVFVIAAPWIIAVDERYPGFTYYYVMVEQVLRYATDAQNRDVSIISFLLAFSGALFPWVTFLPQALRKFVSRSGFKQRKQNRYTWFLFIWAVFMFIFFGMSKSFLFGYLAPLALPLSILVAVHINHIFKNGFTKVDKISIIIPTIVFGLLSIASLVVLFFPIIKDHIWAAAALFLPVSISSIIITILLIKSLRKQCIKKIVICFAVMMVVIGNFGYGVGQYFADMNVKAFAEDINTITKKYPDAKVYTSHRFYEIAFYTKKIPVMVDDEGELPYVTDFANSGAEKYMLPYNDVISSWNASNSLNFLVVRNNPSTHGKEKNHALDDYRKSIDKDKFFILDSNKYATLVASKNISA